MKAPESVFNSLENQGWSVSDEAMSPALTRDLLHACQKSWQEGAFHEAHIGRGQEKTRQSDIRGDSILWLPSLAEATGTTGAATDFLKWAEDFRQQLNERYFLGLRSAEFHFARYPAGKGYQKHLDQHRGSQHRKISLVYYLNENWPADGGGELCLYSPHNENELIYKAQPVGGRLALFRSDLIPHEVLPCFQTRWSLTGWFRTD